MTDRNSFSSSEQDKTTKRTNVVTWILGGVAVIAIAAAIYMGVNSNFFKSETERLQDELTELNATRDTLEGDLAEMETSYDTQIAVNDSLSFEIEERVQEVEGLKQRLSSVRSQLANSKANTEEIKARLAKIEALKAELEADIVNLKEENQELLASSDELSTELAAQKAQVANLNEKVADLTEANQKISEHLYRVAPAGYRADNFSVAFEKRNDKLTSKAKKIDEIRVSFSLDNVPADKQGNGALYLTLTNVLGETVAEVPASEVMVKGRMENLKINAVDAKEVKLQQTQSVDMVVRADKNLEEGEYNLLVFSDHGYLGSTGFVLR